MIRTVKIKGVVSEDNPEGTITINATDFDASKHELVDPADAPLVEKTVAVAASSSGAATVELEAQLESARSQLDDQKALVSQLTKDKEDLQAQVAELTKKLDEASLNDMTVAEIKEELKRLGVDAPDEGKKADFLALLSQARAKSAQ